MEQKAVTIQFCSSGDHGQIEVFLDDYLQSGWRIVSVTPVGCAGGGEKLDVVGWVFVILERVSE